MTLVLEELARAQTKEDALWEEARKKPSYYQKALDETLKTSPEAQKSISRFYAVYAIEKKGSTTDKGALVASGKQLRCYDSSLEKQLKEEVRNHAEAYAKTHNANPAKLKEETERAYSIIVAEMIDRAENNPTDFVNIGQHKGADAYLGFSLWGSGLKCIGLATKQFFEDENYKNAEDRKSYLLDYVAAKAAEQFANTDLSEIWASTRTGLKINVIYVGAVPGMKDTWTAILKNRWANVQADKIFTKKRTVSETYAKSMAQDWQNSPEFKHIVAFHRKNLAEAPKLGSIKHRELNSDSMGKIWGFRYLPHEGAIVAYDPEIVKQYQF
ncbi:MAG: hypothetical protein QW165_04760 [Candidatus Woesearchaeota archaeon]